MRTTVQNGQTLGGRYLVREKLGEGGWGAVFAAVQTDLGRQVAVKVLHADAAFEPDALARFEREARAAAALGHPNIAQVTDFQHHPGEPPFLVMELLPGRTLGDVIQREGRLAAPRVAWIAHQILAALEAAHAAGIVHRDVKPDNVFLVSASGVEDLVKLLDFGIAKLAEDKRRGQEPMTANGAMMGSPAYMAPEQVTGAAVDARTDLYAVGATMYRALTGTFPFDASSLHALLLAITTQPLRPVGTLAPNVDPALAAIVERALAKDPAARFASAASMRAAIEPWTHASRRGPRAGTAAMAPIPMATSAPPATGPMTSSNTPSSPLAGTASPVSPYGASSPTAGGPHGASPASPYGVPPASPYGAPAAMPYPAAPAPPGMAGAPAAPASAPEPARGSGALVVVALLVVLVGLGGIAWLARDRFAMSGDPAASPTATLADAAVPSAVVATATATAPVPVTPSTPGIVRPIPTGRAVDAGAPSTPVAPVSPAPVADAGTRPPITVVDAGGPRKAYGSRRGFAGAGTYGGEGPRNYIGETRDAIGRLQPQVDACFAASEYDPPSHFNPMWTIQVLASGKAQHVQPSPDKGNHPALDACMIPLLLRVTYPPRAKAEELRLSFGATPP